MTTSLELDPSSYGATNSAVIVLRSDTRRGLSRLVAERNRRTSNDNPGGVYRYSCSLLRAIKSEAGGWQGICISNVHFDI